MIFKQKVDKDFCFITIGYFTGRSYGRGRFKWVKRYPGNNENKSVG